MPRALALAALGCALLGCGARTGTLLVAGDHDAGVRRVDASAELCWAPLPLDIERNTMFVIDRSGSMEFDVVDDRSRWDLVSSTLSRALTGVPPSLAIGAKLFPQAVDECAGRVTLTCFVDEGLDLAIAPGNAPALAGILADHGPCGSTPLAPALEDATEGLAASGPLGWMIVITDGAPNCSDRTPPGCAACYDTTEPERLMREAEAMGYPSFVVGIAIDREEGIQAAMDRLAEAGGRPRRPPARPYYDAQDDRDRRRLISLVAGDTSCELSLLSAPTPAARERARVLVGGTEIPFDPTHREGWDWIGPRDVQIFGDACWRAEVEPAAVVAPCEG
ncbi:MAG: vWA domain-containing protein [Sandaracinaceae bacterium]